MRRWLHNLIGGAGTVLELMPPPRDHLAAARRVLAKTDAEALRDDWRAIGLDFALVMGYSRAAAEAAVTTGEWPANGPHGEATPNAAAAD